MSHRLLLHLTVIGLALTGCVPHSPDGSSNHGRLPLRTVFQGESTFQRIVAKAHREHWETLPIGERTMRVAQEFVGTRYLNFTLEVDDHIESPVVNLNAMDCWTYYENSLAFARMLRAKPGPYRPEDLLAMVELERYRNGICTGSYLSRMHHLEEVFADNQRRGLATNITPQLPGATPLHRNVHEMTQMWRSYRYLRANPSLLKPMAKLEDSISRLPVCHIPASKVRAVEPYLRDGDICAITTHDTYGYTSHVGLILRKNGRAYFTHATSDHDKGRRVIIDCPISQYLGQNKKHAGIVICRPMDIPTRQP